MGPKRRLQRGRFLLEMPKQHGARPPDAGLHDATPLKDLGIKKNQSVRLQCMALVRVVGYDSPSLKQRRRAVMDEDKIVAAILTAGTMAAFNLRGLEGVPYKDAERGVHYYRAYLDALEKDRRSAAAPGAST